MPHTGMPQTSKVLYGLVSFCNKKNVGIVVFGLVVEKVFGADC